ncbi:MAG: hypothetical protein H6905_01090 [Hyphomicrobiales bacterium]|nr:hypothetical protein [Hyphomicrobiales bacterium]
MIGGLAVAWYCPDRQADDMDLLIEPTAENSALISRALASLGLGGHSADAFAGLGLQIPIKNVYHAELLTPEKGSASFAEVEANAVDARLFNIPVRLASVSTLISMKRRAIASAESQREKHLRDVECLETRREV